MPDENEIYAWLAQMFAQINADTMRKPTYTPVAMGNWIGNSALGYINQGKWEDLPPDEFFFRAAIWTGVNGYPLVSAQLNSMEGDIVDNEWPESFT